ncbi:hypothetical protein JKP88DRAFT_303960 [Tribonema minus]|uniref:Ankyrin repeat domain containing protein n=1 Tax=Tribonema minus TaxID=303371 RepID=A0A835ZE15_9STRA|nr:hypothetical protein JKP88DRAFT_303960 [Tribonema minus]
MQQMQAIACAVNGEVDDETVQDPSRERAVDEDQTRFVGAGAAARLDQSIWGHCLSYLGPGRFLCSAISKKALAAYRMLFDQATTTISADLFATLPMARLALTGRNCIAWDHHRVEAMRALTDAPREVLEHVTPLMLNLLPSYLGAMYWRTLAERGRLGVLQWGAAAHGFRPSAEAAIAAVRGGRVDVLHWLHELAPWTVQTTHCLLKNAATCGQTGVVEWLFGKRGWRDGAAAACAAAAATGQLPALQLLRAHYGRWDHNTFSEAAANGRLEVMEWAMRARAPVAVDDAHRRAARYGARASLEWLEARFYGTPWDADVFACAAESGDVELLRWLCARGCPWDAHASRVAASNGRVPALEWLRAAAAPFALDVCDVAYGSREDAAFEWAGHVFDSPPALWAAADLATMRWLHAHGLTCDARAMAAALERADATATRWLLYAVGGAAWDHRACVAAAFAGDLASLAPLHAACRAAGGGSGSGSGHDEAVCAAAAAGGHARVLRWARAAGCAWDERVCAEARLNGHLDVLEWAAREGCPCGAAELQCLRALQTLS